MVYLRCRSLVGLVIVLLTVSIAACGGGGGDAATASAQTDSGGGVGSSGSIGSGGGTTTAPVTITNTTPSEYQWSTLVNGEDVYVDRNYTFDGVPSSYQGLDLLQTANDDKFASGSQFVSFDVNQPVTVYVGYDPQWSPLPAWLQSWADTGDVWQATHLGFDVYSKDFPAGTVILGGNEFGGSNYSVAIRSQVAGGPLAIGGTPPTSATQGTAYSFAPTVGGGTGTYTFSVANKPAWASFDPGTGALSGTPGAGDVGTTTGIVISVNDGQSSASLGAFQIVVDGTASGVATLSWTAPSTSVDNSPLTDLAGYRIHYGTSVGSYPNKKTINNSGVTTAMVENLAPGVWNFVVTAFDTSGNESAFSNVASKTIDPQ